MKAGYENQVIVKVMTLLKKGMKEMKTVWLTSCLSMVAAFFVVSASQAAPSCCDPTQTQGQASLCSPVTQSNRSFPVGPSNTYVPAAPQTIRVVAPEPRSTHTTQSRAYGSLRASGVQSGTAQVNSAYSGTEPPVAGFRASGCCGGTNAPNYSAAVPMGGSCCGSCGGCGFGGHVARQLQSPTAPAAPSCCAVGSQSPPLARQPLKETGPISKPYGSAKAISAAIPANVQSKAAFTAQRQSIDSRSLRFGSLW
jgi:hypothetical protein